MDRSENLRGVGRPLVRRSWMSNPHGEHIFDIKESLFPVQQMARMTASRADRTFFYQISFSLYMVEKTLKILRNKS